MKRLIIILLCLFLVSCQRVGQDYFSQPRTLYVTLEWGDGEITGILETEPGRTAFYPDKPEGLEITVTDVGGVVGYKGLDFENSTVEMTYISALHKELHGDGVKFNRDKNPQTITLGDIRLTVHKEQ